MSDMDGAASPDGQAQVGGQPFNVGDIVRLDNHYLGRIMSFGEEFPPWGRVVRCEPLVTHPDTPQPPGTRPYGGSDGPLVEWESKLTPAHPGDIGAHLRWPDGRTSGPGYVNVGPNWKPGLSTVQRADTITAAALDFPGAGLDHHACVICHQVGHVPGNRVGGHAYQGPARVGHHAEGADARGWMVVHPGMAGQVTADFPGLRSVGGELVRMEHDGLAEAMEWARRILASDPQVDAVTIRQSVQEYDGQPWKAGRHVQTVTRPPAEAAAGSGPGRPASPGGPSGDPAVQHGPGPARRTAARPQTAQPPRLAAPKIPRRPR